MAFSSKKWWTTQDVAVVTGGNKGIGLEIGRNLAKEGLTTVITARKEANGLNAVKELGEKHIDKDMHAAWPMTRGRDLLLGLTDHHTGSGSNIHYHQLDISDSCSVASFASWVKDTFPQGISILVNNAGFAFKGSIFGADEAQITFDTNLFGTVAITRAVLPLVRDGGRIVTVSSRAGSKSIVPSERLKQRIAGIRTEGEAFEMANEFVSLIRSGQHKEQGYPSSMYGMSKLLLSSHCQVLASELNERGVSVSACCPGWCQTDMSSGSGNKTAAQGADTPTWLALRDDEFASGRFWAEREKLPF